MVLSNKERQKSNEVQKQKMQIQKPKASTWNSENTKTDKSIKQKTCTWKSKSQKIKQT